jgi:succinyl-CoA synthetase alpha subunit
MAIFLTKNSKVIVQGMTGSEGSKHTQRMLTAGTTIVGGVTPGKGGQKVDFDGVRACRSSGRRRGDGGPAPTCRSSSSRRVRQGRRRRGGRRRHPARVVITEGIPVHDTAGVLGAYAAAGGTTRIIGPNCPGLISPGKSNAGIIPADITKAGPIGLVSASRAR